MGQLEEADEKEQALAALAYAQDHDLVQQTLSFALQSQARRHACAAVCEACHEPAVKLPRRPPRALSA